MFQVSKAIAGGIQKMKCPKCKEITYVVDGETACCGTRIDEPCERVIKSAAITIKDGMRVVRISASVDTSRLDLFMSSLESALAGYFKPGVTIESIYFFEERT